MVEIGQNIKEKYCLKKVLWDNPLFCLYLAEDLISLKPVWVQYFKPEHLNLLLLQKLSNLSSTMARIEHPNVLKILEFFQENNSFFVIFEAGTGQYLEDYLKFKKKLGFNEALEILIQAVEALSHVSKSLITHGSLDLNKILVESNGQIKIFGFALESAIIADVYSRLGFLPVKGYFLAPEQFKGEFFRESSDLYSLGVIFYSLLTGKLPFEGENNADLAFKHQNENLDFASLNVPESVREILVGLLQKDPGKRFSSWENLREFLKNKEVIKNFMTLKNDFMQAEKNFKSNDTQLDDFKNQKSNSSFFPVLLLGIFLGILLSSLYPSLRFFKPEVTLPDLRGEEREKAEAILKNLNLRPVISGELPDIRIDKGKVVFSEPKENTRVKEGRIIRLYLSSGRTLVRVPRFVGLNIEEAKNIAKGTNFFLELDSASRLIENPQAVVMAQAPLPDAEIPYESTILVSLVKNKNIATVVLPDLVGEELLKAKDTLKNLSLNLGRIIYQGSSLKDKNKILKQNPKAGSSLLPFMPVDLIVGGGPEFPEVDIHLAKVEFSLPKREKVWLVSLEVEDSVGLNLVYQKAESGGQVFNWTVVGVGESKLKIYLDGKLLGVKQF